MARAKSVRFPADGSNPELETARVVHVTADGAIAIPDMDTVFVITKGSACAMTLADPAVADNGTILYFISTTAFAHTVDNTAGSGFNGGTHKVATLDAQVDAGFALVADGGKWYVVPGKRIDPKVVVVSADGAIAVPSADTTYFVTKASAAALTLVDPAAGDDGRILHFVSTTAFAHTLDNTAGSGFNGGSHKVATMGGQVGDGFAIVAKGTKWYVLPNTKIDPKVVALAGSGAVAIPSSDQTLMITAAGAAALTIADPAAADNGLTLTFISTTAQAHTLDNSAGSGFFSTGGASKDVATFAAAIGNGLTIKAFNTKWYIVPNSAAGITLG